MGRRDEWVAEGELKARRKKKKWVLKAEVGCRVEAVAIRWYK